MRIEEISLGPEYSDIDVKHILRNATREGRTIFEIFSVKGKGEHLVASKMRWDECPRLRRPQDERMPKESRGSEEDRDKQVWAVDHEDRAKRMLRYVENSEALKVSLSELKEQLESLEGAEEIILKIAKQEINGKGGKPFQILRQEENEKYIASGARWDAQLEG